MLSSNRGVSGTMLRLVHASELKGFLQPGSLGHSKLFYVSILIYRNHLKIAAHLNFIRDGLMKVHEEIYRPENIYRWNDPAGRAYYGDESVYIDRLADRTLMKLVKERYDRYTYISEESGIEVTGNNGFHILVDPIDGSTNARRGVPLFATTIAVASGNRYQDIFAAGLMYHTTGDLIWGYKGNAFFNWRKIKFRDDSNVHMTMIGFTANMRGGRVELFKLIQEVGYPRIFGATAVEIALILNESMDAYVSYPVGTRPFDFMPSLFLVQQAGGKAISLSKYPISDIPLDAMGRFPLIVALNLATLNRLLEILKVKGKPGF